MRALSISEWTVQDHLKSVFAKTGCEAPRALHRALTRYLVIENDARALRANDSFKSAGHPAATLSCLGAKAARLEVFGAGPP